MPNNQHFPFHDLHFKVSDEQTYDEHDPVCDVNKDKINVDNHPIILARGRFRGYRGEYGAIGEMGRLGSELFGDLKEGGRSKRLVLWLRKGRTHRLRANRQILVVQSNFQKKTNLFSTSHI